MMVFPPHRKKLLRAWCPVLLGLFFAWWVHATVDKILSAGFSENQTQDDRTLRSDGTTAMWMGLTASHGCCPAGQSPLREPATTNCGQTVECQVVRELDFHRFTFRPAGGDGSARWHPVGPALDSYQASRGLDTVNAVSSETQTDVCSAMDDNTNELTQIGTDSVTWDWVTLPVKAAAAMTSAGPAGSCQTAGSHESRSTSTQPGGPKVLTALQH